MAWCRSRAMVVAMSGVRDRARGDLVEECENRKIDTV